MVERHPYQVEGIEFNPFPKPNANFVGSTEWMRLCVNVPPDHQLHINTITKSSKVTCQDNVKPHYTDASIFTYTSDCIWLHLRLANISITLLCSTWVTLLIPRRGTGDVPGRTKGMFTDKLVLLCLNQNDWASFCVILTCLSNTVNISLHHVLWYLAVSLLKPGN